MADFETVFQTLMTVNTAGSSPDSTRNSHVSKDEILKQYAGGTTYTEGKEESPAICEECIQKVKFKVIRAVSLCFRCNVYLCFECAAFHCDHMNQISSGVDSNQNDSKQAALREFENVYKELNMESNFTLSQSLSSNKTNVLNRFKIRHSSDWKEDCWIRDICVLDNGFVAITESDSESIKLFDKNYEFIRRIQFQTWPCGIVQIPQKWTIDQIKGSLENPMTSNVQIGITLPVKGSIITLSLDNESGTGLVDKEIILDSKGECYWLLFHEGLFITMCETKPPTCHFITMSGITLKVLDLYFDSVNVTDWYPRIAINPMTETLYVSSYDDNLVFSMDLCGTLLKYTTETVLKNGNFVPYGITVDAEQNVYVCSEKDNTIYKFSQDLSQREIFADESICRIDSPAVIASSKGKFYVSHDTDLSNIVTVIGTR